MASSMSSLICIGRMLHRLQVAGRSIMARHNDVSTVKYRVEILLTDEILSRPRKARRAKKRQGHDSQDGVKRNVTRHAKKGWDVRRNGGNKRTSAFQRQCLDNAAMAV